MSRYTFNYKTLKDIREKADSLGVSLPLSENVDILGQGFDVGGVPIHNRMGVAPMEGFDSNPDGTPSELARQRYLGYAKGGAGLVWFEAITIVPEGRSSQKQLFLTKETLPAFQRLLEEMKETCLKHNGFVPYLVMQANHSGRYSRPNPEGRWERIIAYHHPEMEKDGLLPDSCIATDDYLERLEEEFGVAAELSREAGFDAFDVKSCHGYLLGELASAYTRKGKYGGSFENRFRLLLNGVRSAQRAQTKEFTITARINIYDNFAYPYGFGMAKDGSLEPDYEEPIRLLKLLHEDLGMPFVNLTMGDPHVQPHISRPYNLDDKFTPPEDPLTGVARMYSGIGVVKRAVPGLKISASAPSYLRHFAPNLAAGAIEQGICDHVCFGRLAFANPNFPNDVIAQGGLKPNQACVGCSKCSALGRAGRNAGCVIRNPEPYLQWYRDMIQK